MTSVGKTFKETASKMNKKTNRHAFTLVELLIVVVILAILAAIALPKLSNASSQARNAMLADNLRIIRTQIAVFRGQHLGVSPGFPDGDADSTPTESTFVAHMTMSSNKAGEVASVGTDGYGFGPYMSSIPLNPVNDKSTVQIIGNSASIPGEGDDSHGWIYQPSTSIFFADSNGEDENGKEYIDY